MNQENSTLIPKKENSKAEGPPKARPNGNMAQAHAEIGVIQQAYEQGMTKGQDMTMTLKGKLVCSYCISDVASMGKAAELKSIKIHEDESGKTLYWEPGMRRLVQMGDK